MSTENQASLFEKEIAENEKMALKYKFLKEKIIQNYNKGSRILKICKITAAAIFILFTLIGIAVSHRTNHEIQWLQAWVLVIFLNITVFVIADYSKYLVESKVIPYLENDEQIEFGEYDIFSDDIDNESETEKEEEE